MTVLETATNGASFTLSEGFAAGERARIAEIYADAFEGKLGRILGRGPRMHAFLADSLKSEFALVARDRSTREIIGILGVRTEAGGLTAGFGEAMPRHYGWFGARWRGVVLELLETPERADKLLIDGIAIATDRQGEGIGTALLSAAEARAIALGKSALRLDVIDRNLRARALYARLGFVETGTHDLGLLRHAFGFARATQMTKML